MPSVESEKPGVRVEFCNVYGATPFIDEAKPGEGCIRVPPMYVNPDMLDYRLAPNSLCIGKASDGGDIGVRYTAEMLEMLKRALELRQQGLIKF